MALVLCQYSKTWKQEMAERSADDRLSEKNKVHTVLAHCSFDLRRRLWNTIVSITLKIIMAELMVALSARRLVIIRRRHRRETVVCSAHPTLRWFASTPPIRNVIEQLADNQSEYPMMSNPRTAVHTVPKASNTAEHTKQICSQTRHSFLKRFRRPTFGPVCSCL